MIGRVLGSRRVRQLRRVARNCQLTFFCLFLTLLMFRGYLGGGKFGTPEHDLEDLRKTFSYIRRRTDPRRVLEAQGRKPTDVKNYAEFDVNEFFRNEDDDADADADAETAAGESTQQHHPLGPKISDWDEQRSEWLKTHPNLPNYISQNKPRVLLVTGSSPKPCENSAGDHFLLKSIKNKIDYCRLHGIDIFYNMALLDAEMSGFWAKLPLIRHLLLSHPEVELLWWMDSDAFFTDMSFEVPWQRYQNHSLVMHGWDDKVYNDRDWVGLNTGSFLLRNSQWSLDILDALAPMGRRGNIRDEAGKLLSKELKDRPVFEADDQSAMVYLLATQRDRWGERVYLENAYYLHGFWEILVDRFEEMIEKHRPGVGDDRWPLVTHFVGCKPCGKVGDYPVGRCLKQMERAFNFGDNQILEIYGFRHQKLSSRRLVKTNHTTKPNINNMIRL